MIQRTQFLDQHTKKKNQRVLSLLAANTPLESGVGLPSTWEPGPSSGQTPGTEILSPDSVTQGETSFRVLFCSFSSPWP